MVPFAFTGVSMAHPRLFEGSPEGAFSLNAVWSTGDRGGARLRHAHGGHLDARRQSRCAGARPNSSLTREILSSRKQVEPRRAWRQQDVRRASTPLPPGRPFLTALAEALLAGNLPVPGGRRPDPLQLADTTLLLPTRRATRALQEAFLKASGGGALLLPKIKPIVGGRAKTSI